MPYYDVQGLEVDGRDHNCCDGAILMLAQVVTKAQDIVVVLRHELVVLCDRRSYIITCQVCGRPWLWYIGTDKLNATT